MFRKLYKKLIFFALPFGGANGSEMYKFAEFYNILHYYLHDLSFKDQMRVSNVYLGKLIAYTYCAYFWSQGNLPFLEFNLFSCQDKLDGVPTFHWKCFLGGRGALFTPCRATSCFFWVAGVEV